MDIFYTDATYIDDAAYTMRPAAEPILAHRRLRNWHKFVLFYLPIMAGGALLLYVLAGWQIAALGLAVWLLTAVVILLIAWRMRRL